MPILRGATSSRTTPNAANDMYDVFLAYSSADRTRLEPLVRAFKQQGWSVFVDHRDIGGGDLWKKKIQKAIHGCKSVVAVWSKHSILADASTEPISYFISSESAEWVNAEVEVAKRRGILLPIILDKDIKPPFGFAAYQALDFSQWQGDIAAPVFQTLAAAVRRQLDAARQAQQNELTKQQTEPIPSQAIPQQSPASEQQAQDGTNSFTGNASMPHLTVSGSFSASLEPFTVNGNSQTSEISSEIEKSPSTDKQTAPQLENGGFVAGLAGFTSEFCGVGSHAHVPDHLGVEGEANRLAELIALRETKLPLAIGLFGNWGSGKSHFMNLMDRRMKHLANQEQTDSSGTWCREIVPIYFNAWHYLDTNLWASLVTEIFEGLFRHISPNTDTLAVRAEKIKNLMDELQKAEGAVASAEEDIKQAREAKTRAELEVQQVEKAVKEAATQRDKVKGFIAGVMDNLRSLLPDNEMEVGWKKAVEVLHLEDARESYSTFTAQVAEFKTLQGRARAVVRALLATEGKAWRIFWLLGAVLGAPLVAGWLMRILAQNWSAEIHQIEMIMSEITVSLVAIGGWCGVQLQRGRALLGQLESMEKAARKKRANKAESAELIAKRAELATFNAAEASAGIQLKLALESVKKIEAVLQEAQPERRLFRFIEQRAQAQDYRAHLGLISLVRKDFHELSRLFAEKDSSVPTQANTLSASIDRIVLFVDDLDRCQPEKVVDVLQAVHLLLAYPLFAVVVGVDQRCLKQSLETEFKGLVTNGKTPKSEGYQATSLDYLEKIFHIPFHLPTMGETGFSTLIENLTEHSVQISPEIPEPEARQQKPETPPPEHEDSGNTPIAPAPKPSKPKKLSSTPLARWERDALKDYHSLIHSPRGAKRLLNTYRLVRAGIPENEWQDFAGDDSHNGDFRVAMLLLAAAAGHPSVVREWFKLLRNHDWTTTDLTDVPLDEASKKSWDDFRTAFTQTFDKITQKPSTKLFEKWLDRVERFTF